MLSSTLSCVSITLVDLDEVCASNINRQLCALSSTVGRFKADVLRDRVRDINPDANVTVLLGYIGRAALIGCV